MTRAEDIFWNDLEEDLKDPSFADAYHRTLREITEWTVDPHDSTPDTLTVEHAADHLNELLGE